MPHLIDTAFNLTKKSFLRFNFITSTPLRTPWSITRSFALSSHPRWSSQRILFFNQLKNISPPETSLKNVGFNQIQKFL